MLRAAPDAMRETSPFGPRRWTSVSNYEHTIQHKWESGRFLTDSGDYALMCVLHLARYGGKPACTFFEVAITLCRDSHEVHVQDAISRETANSLTRCLDTPQYWS